MAVYPAALSNLKETFAGTDQVATEDHAAVHNAVADEVNAIEATLGINPQGPYASTVSNRFEISAYKMQSCRFATTVALPAVTYANGTAGVGATLTANANGVMAAVDGVTPVAGDRMLVKNQAAPLQNGIYVVTSIGAAGAPFVLTRHYDADTSTKLADSKVLIDTGNVCGDTEWYQSSTAPTIGTTALYFRRSQPIYGHGNPRSAWGINATNVQVIMETFPRPQATGLETMVLTTATQYLWGGIVCPAGRPVSNISFVATTAGAAPTIDWFALARQSDRLVMCHTANSTSAPTANVETKRAFTTPWTPIEDTPVWVVFSLAVATTARILLATGSGGSTAANLLAPAQSATNGVTPTTTVPTDGTTVITGATAGRSQTPYVWLT